MIRDRIKKDLKEAIEESGVLQGNFLDNIEWLLKTINKDNFEDFPDPLPVGKLQPEIQKVIGAKNDLVYLKPRIYAKIRGWWRHRLGHPELGDGFYQSLPLALNFPTTVLADKQYKNTFLLVTEYEEAWLIVIELVGEGGRWEIKTMFLIDSRRIDKEYETVWQAKKKAPLGGLAGPSVLALRRNVGVAGARFPSLQRSSTANDSTNNRGCQQGALSYQKIKLSLDDVHLEHPGNPEHGDYSSNVAMTPSSENKEQRTKNKNPQEIAELIVSKFPKTDYLEKIEVAPPGFINFYLRKSFLQGQVGEILKQGGECGLNKELRIKNKGTRVQVEFISANPTGPLHVGNARGGFCGDVLANVLEKVGYQVQREYYINDKGVQVDKVAESVKICCDALNKHLVFDKVDIAASGYAGDYVKEIAQKAQKEGLESLEDFKSFAISEVLDNIKKTIGRMGVKFDQFFSETSLYDGGDTEKAIEFLRAKNLLYEKEGAVWFKSSKFGDEKDRVLIKSSGEMTYLVSDVAYHLDKFEKRKFDKVILFWGADHHGYIPRFMAMMEAIGHKGKAQVELIQLLKLVRGGKEVRMSKRTGEFVTVDEVLDEIGLDAARFHFLAVPLNTAMTLDLEKAKEQNQKNPVYYVQYACARMHSILAKAQSAKCKVQSSKLNHPTELALIRKLLQFSEIVMDISENHEIHRLPQYSVEVADAFHRFYENCQVFSDDKDLTAARLGLVKATQTVLTETLGLMGISAPEKM